MPDKLLVSDWTPTLFDQGGGVLGIRESGVSGAPSISGTSGTFAQDNSFTINGSNISANRSGQLIYENFDAGVDGTEITDISSFSYTPSATPAQKYVYEDAVKYSGSKSAFLDYVTGNASGFLPRFDPGQNLNTIFVSMKVRTDIISETAPDTQIKYPRVISQSDDHTSQPQIGMTYIPSSTIGFQQSDGTAIQAFFGNDLSDGVWQSVLYYVDLSTINVRDGSRFIKAMSDDTWTFSGYPGENFASVSDDGVGGSGVSGASWLPGGNINTLQSGGEETFLRFVLLPFFKRTADIYKIYVDQVFINDSLECVFVSPESTWTVAKAAIDTLVTQEMTSRTSTAVVINCEIGDLGGTKYLYVLNSNGEANETGVSV